MTDILLLALVALLTILVWRVQVLVTETRRNGVKLQRIEAHQINPRTRIAQAIMDSGPPSHDKDMARLGRLSQGRRVVVGGDDDSQLNKDLRREVEG